MESVIETANDDFNTTLMTTMGEYDDEHLKEFINENKKPKPELNYK